MNVEEAIKILTAEKGDAVTIFAANPEHDPGRGNGVSCTGFWTDFIDRTFYADSMLDCLNDAVRAYQTQDDYIVTCESVPELVDDLSLVIQLCEATRVNDEQHCARCGLQWPADDPEPPAACQARPKTARNGWEKAKKRLHNGENYD